MAVQPLKLIQSFHETPSIPMLHTLLQLNENNEIIVRDYFKGTTHLYDINKILFTVK